MEVQQDFCLSNRNDFLHLHFYQPLQSGHFLFILNVLNSTEYISGIVWI